VSEVIVCGSGEAVFELSFSLNSGFRAKLMAEKDVINFDSTLIRKLALALLTLQLTQTHHTILS
jgi:hypothetical protein